MSETNNNNNNIIELLSDDSDNEEDKKPAAVATTKRANMLCQFFPKKDPVPLAATAAAKRKQETPKRFAMMNGFSDMTPTPQPIFILRDPSSYSSSSASRFQGYDLELTGPPEAWSRPSFMAWFGEDGRLKRRVVNANRHKQDHLRRMVTGMLMENYGLNPSEHPIFPKGLGVAVEMEFHRRPPNDDFVANDRQRPLKERILKAIIGDKVMMDEKRPDIDNLGKFILDALQGIAYEDDAQVVSVAMKKVLDTNPPFEGRTYISFRAVNNLDTMPIISMERKRNTKAAVPGSPFESDTL